MKKLCNKIHALIRDNRKITIGICSIVLLLFIVALVVLLNKKELEKEGLSPREIIIEQIKTAIPGEDYVEDEIVVRIASENEALKFAKDNNINLIQYRELSRLASFRVKDKDEIIKTIKANDIIIEPNWIFTTAAIENNPDYQKQWGYQAMGVETAYNQNIKGSGVRVAVIDSGIDVNHPEFIGRISNSSFNSCLLVQDPSHTTSDFHGTEVAGIIAANDDNNGIVGVAPEVELLVINLECSSGSVYNFTLGTILDALFFINPLNSDFLYGVFENSNFVVDIVNMSFGMKIGSLLLKQEIDSLSEQGIILVASSGNDGYFTSLYPAAYDNVISVGAVQYCEYCNPKLKIAEVPGWWGSNGGADFVAPGDDIFTTTKNGYVYDRGTSFAAPYITGVIALLLSQNPNYTYTEIYEILKNSSVKYIPGFKETYFGWGMPIVDDIFKKKVTVTFDFQFNNKLNNIVVAHGTKITKPSTIDRDGHRLIGWFKDLSNSNEWNFENDIVTEDIVLYAKWEKIEELELPGHYQNIEWIDDGLAYYSYVLENNLRVNYVFGFKSNSGVSSGDRVTRKATNGMNSGYTAILVGDVNGDGKVDYADILLLNDFLVGRVNLSTVQLKAADINNDGIITHEDNNLLWEYVETKQLYRIDQRSFRSIISANQQCAGVEMYGDINGDGRINAADLIILTRYIEGISQLTPRQQCIADVNKDGILTYLDVVILRQYIAGGYGITLPSDKKEVLGDADWDGVVTLKDAQIIRNEYIPLHKIYPSRFTWNIWYIADVNGDGVVDEKDAVLIEKYVNGNR